MSRLRVQGVQGRVLRVSKLREQGVEGCGASVKCAKVSAGEAVGSEGRGKEGVGREVVGREGVGRDGVGSEGGGREGVGSEGVGSDRCVRARRFLRCAGALLLCHLCFPGFVFGCVCEYVGGCMWVYVCEYVCVRVCVCVGVCGCICACVWVCGRRLLRGAGALLLCLLCFSALWFVG